MNDAIASGTRTSGLQCSLSIRLLTRLGYRASQLVLFLVFMWTLMGLVYTDHWLPNGLSYGLAFLFLVLIGLSFRIDLPTWFAAPKSKALGLLKPRAFRFTIILLTFVFTALFYASRKPTNDREWSASQARLPSATINENQITISNVRSFRYRNEEVVENYTTQQYDLNEIDSVWFGVDRFAVSEAMAHTFISFGFRSKTTSEVDFVAFSVETRREKHETSYSPLRGVYRNYEIIYVIADEQDVLSHRSSVPEHPVQLYPVKANKATMRVMFRDMLDRANGLLKNPEFYNTITSNCTNNIVYHVNRATTWPITPFERGVIFPGYSDWLAFRHDLIATDLDLEQAREVFRIDNRVQQYDGDGSDFSEFIRADMPPQKRNSP